MVDPDRHGQPRINRINYEMHTLQALRERVRCKDLWLPGARRYRNPEGDLPTDFLDQRTAYYQALRQPLDPETFIAESRTLAAIIRDNTSIGAEMEPCG